MQEVYHDGSEGEVKEFDSLKDMLPELEKSLKKKRVKYVKVMLIPDGNRLKTEEVNKNILDAISEQK